jgi:hypothetical protein
MTETAQRTLTLLVFGIFRVLAADEFDNQAPLAANEVGVAATILHTGRAF